MKLLVLTNLYPPHHIGGYELICETVVEHLLGRGHQIVVLTSDHKEDLRTAAGAQNAPGFRTSDHDPSWKNGFAIERELLINGLYGHRWHGICRLASVERHNNEVLRRAIARHQPDLVYVWNMGGISKSILFTLQKAGLPSVFYISDHWLVRGLRSDVWLRWWNEPQKSVLRGAVRRACELTGVRRRWQEIAPTNPVSSLEFRNIYFCSRALRDWTAQQGCPVQHGSVIYCPVHDRYLQGPFQEPRPRLKRLLYAGRLAEDKGVLTALRALECLRGKVDAELSVCGSGEDGYVRGLKTFASKNGLAVRFTTAASGQMPGIYREHDALLFTSEWAEPFALTPLEAMACGLPVIGTTTGGSAELFRDRENALTYSAGNAAELAQRIAELSANKSLRGRCARLAYFEARERYAAPVIVGQIESFLQDALRQWRRPPISVAHGLSPCKS